MSFLVLSNLLLFIVGLINFIFGLVLVINTRDPNRSQLFFAGLSSFASLWTMCMAFYRYTLEYSDIAVHILYLIPLAIPLFFVLFVDEYSKELSFNFKLTFIKKSLFAWAGLLIALVIFGDTIVIEVSIPEYGEKIITFGFLYFLYVMYFSFSFSVGYFILYKIYRSTSNALVKRQSLFLLLGTVLTGVLALITNVLLPWINYFMLNWVGNLATIFYVLLIFYATIYHKLFNLRTITAETTVFILWLVLLIRVAFSNTRPEFLLDISILAASIILGVLLVRSISKEIENREKGERLARYLANANARLRELDNQKTEFVSIASHQLRSPIAAIKGYAAMMAEGSYGKVPKGLDEPIKRILESGQRIGIMVDDFLNVTRIEQGRMTYDMKPHYICSIIADVVKELQVVANDKGLQLTSQCDKKAGLQIQADEGKIKQIFSNLIDNAIKYTHKGKIIITVESLEKEEKVLVHITDTGIGIAPEELKNLFQKFNRASNANEANVLGTGLGLYIAREIMKAHEGWIDVKSDGIGKGSTFTVELPAYYEMGNRNDGS